MDLTEYEKSTETEYFWVEIDEAIKLINSSKPPKDKGKAWYLAKFFNERDTLFIEEISLNKEIK